MELCLGTVQLGKKYGINNKEGKPSENDSFRILDIAVQNGIRCFDTAPAYEDAERILGDFIAKTGNRDIRLVSKLRPGCFENGFDNCKTVIETELKSTLQKLHVDSLYGYILHNSADIYHPEVTEALADLQKQGLIQKYGVSIYEMEEGFESIKRNCTMVQMPFSVFDQRGLHSGFLKAAAAKNVEVNVRSVFLQGLLMMEVKDVPAYLQPMTVYLEQLNELCRETGISKKQLLIGYVKNIKEIDKIVFGVDNAEQLEEFIALYRCAVCPPEVSEKISRLFQNIKEDLLLPYKWGK